MTDVGHCHTATHYYVSETKFLRCLQIGVVARVTVKILPARLLLREIGCVNYSAASLASAIASISIIASGV